MTKLEFQIQGHNHDAWSLFARQELFWQVGVQDQHTWIFDYVLRLTWCFSFGSRKIPFRKMAWLCTYTCFVILCLYYLHG